MNDERATVMPVWSPPFGTPPFPMLSAELLMVQFEADRAEIERITPAPLQPAEHNRLTAFVGECSQLSHSLRYHEVAILQEVSHEGRPAITIPYIWTSTDTALVAGRDLYGMPKLLCDDDQLHKHANEVTGRLHRGGTAMMELSMVIDGEADPATIPILPSFAMVRHIPSPDPDYPALRQLIWLELQEFALHQAWAGRGHVRMLNPLSSGLGRLAPGKITGAWYGTFSWQLPFAKILWEDRV
jgi:acetoacetate decarboxylase